MRSIARCLAAVISQAPGLSGTPDSGHCSSAATRASCARSSATPTSRTIRARPAISLADSILQTASIARCASEAITASDQPACRRRLLVVGRPRPQPLLLVPELGRELVTEVLGLEHLPDLDLGLSLVRIGTALDPFDRLVQRLHLDQPVARDQLLRLREGAVDHGALPSGELHPRALRARLQPLASEQHAGVHQLLVELAHLGEELLAGKDARLALLVRLEQKHESHRRVSLWFGFAPYRCVERPVPKSTPSRDSLRRLNAA